MRTTLTGLTLMASAVLIGHRGQASAQDLIPFPSYNGVAVVQGIYEHHVYPQWLSFMSDAKELKVAAGDYCAERASAPTLVSAWKKARISWMTASNPAIGPTVARRSQREIDFWPARPRLLERALDARPQTLDQMKQVGGPAKGFPAMDVLLMTPSVRVHCPYLVLLAEGIEAEAISLSAAFAEAAAKPWGQDEEASRRAYAEWVNQWLGGLESLRWQQIEQPIQKARTNPTPRGPAFARQKLEDNLADWRAQWSSLKTQATLNSVSRATPPAPGQSLVPIEAVLLGKGHIQIAKKWTQVIDMADAAMTALPPQPSERDLLNAAQALKAVAVVYQNEVAAALDVPLGFSSADGD